MNTQNYPVSLQGTEEKARFADIIKKWEEDCSNCKPLTPLACVMECDIWKQKNELRMLYERMRNPGFMTNLLNSLKNKRRLQILNTISSHRRSITELQKELKKLGYYHSQQTIANEYLVPLIEMGLVKENQNQYNTTLFGCRLNEIIKSHSNIEDILPPHSECYEEIILNILLGKPKTHKDFEGIIPAKSIARVLNRLQKANLIEKPRENDLVYYFRTKRDANKAKFSPTEKKIYENIPPDGISARKLSENTNISLRRTYKYIKKLKGKKLVFSRNKPKFYTLTSKGVNIAKMLDDMHHLALEALATASQIINIREIHKSPTLNNR